ncbi:MAG: twin-arginine translocase TatA/TatE family subunit [Alphaproteobacteria bacterium]|nr:twin-arginine translocase TatA/TatE family subunit [Alphaproteobacteria bacterium]
MGSFGPLHWILLIAVALLLFGGRGKISELMGDFAKGIRSFRKGLADEDAPATPSSASQRPAQLPEDRIEQPTTINKDNAGRL